MSQTSLRTPLLAWIALICASLTLAFASPSPARSATPRPVQELASEFRAEMSQLSVKLNDSGDAQLLQQLAQEVSELHRISAAYVEADAAQDKAAMATLPAQYQDHFVVAAKLFETARQHVTDICDKMQPTLLEMTSYGPNVFYQVRDGIVDAAPEAARIFWSAQAELNISMLEARFDVEARVRRGEVETPAMVEEARRSRALQQLQFHARYENHIKGQEQRED